MSYICKTEGLLPGAKLMTVLEAIDSAEKGPICTEREFDSKMIGPKARQICEDFDIEYDPDDVVPADDSLADEVFEAGLRLALETGLYCRNSSRIIKFTESELKESIIAAPDRLVLGAGKDAVTMRSREVESSLRPLIGGGGCGQPVTEDLFVSTFAAMARNPIIDVFSGSLTLSEVYGRHVQSGSPLEVLLVKREMELCKEGLRVVGRPGMHLIIGGGPTALSSIPACSSDGGFSRTDGHLIGILPEMKTDYTRLSLALHLMDYGAISIALVTPMIGYAGGPEVSAIIGVASNLLSASAYGVKYFSIEPMDLAYPSCSTTRKCIWVENVVGQAFSRNTRALMISSLITAAGLCTDMILYETAAVTIGNVPSGFSMITGVGASSTKNVNGSGALEGKFMGECAKASVSLKRSEARPIVLQLLKKYEDRSKNPPRGLLFPECYDTKTGIPFEKTESVYEQIKADLTNMGLRFP